MYLQKHIFHLLVCGLVPLTVTPVIFLQAEVAQAETTPQLKSELMQQAEEGWALAQQGKLEEARQVFEQTLQVAKQRSDRDAQVLSMAGFGIIYSQQGQPEKALEVYQQALQLAENVSNSRTNSMILILIGKEYYNLKKFPEALEVFEQVRAVYQNTLEPSEKAWLLQAIGGVRVQLQQSDKALEVWLQALEIYTSLDRQDAAIGVMWQIGGEYRKQKQYETALQYLTQALALQKAQPEPNPLQEKTIEIELAETQKLYGDDLFRQGKAQAAIAQYQQSLEIVKKYGARSKEVFVLNAIGIAWNNLGEYAKAIDFYQQSLAVLKLIDDKQASVKDIRTAESIFLTNIGNTYEQWADTAVDETTDAKYNQAQEYFRQAAAIYRELGDRAQEAYLLESMARIYAKKLGEEEVNNEKAIEFYHRALVSYQALNDKIKAAETLTNIGGIYDSWGVVSIEEMRQVRLNKAVEFYQQALAIYRDMQERDREVALLRMIARVYSQESATGEEAVKLYRQAIAIFQASNDDLKVANMLDSIGQTYFELITRSRADRQEYSAKALEFQQQALAIYQKLNDRPSQLRTLKWIQAAAIMQEDYFKALEAYRQILAVKAGRQLDVSQIFNASGDRKSPLLLQPTVQTPTRGEANARLASNSLLLPSSGHRTLVARLLYLSDPYQETSLRAEAEGYFHIMGTAFQQMRASRSQTIKTSEFNQNTAEIVYQKTLAISFEFVRQAFISTVEEVKMQQKSNRISHPFLVAGLLYLQQGQVDVALEFYQRALAISREFGDRAMEGNVLSYLGQVHDAIDKPEKALENYQQALVLLKESGDRYAEETTLAQMGKTLLRIGNPSLAEEVLSDSLNLWEARKTIWIAEAVSDERLNAEEDLASSFFYATGERIYHHLQRALIAQNKYQAALEVSERGRARSLIGLLLDRFQNPDGQQPKRVSPPPDLPRIQQVAKTQNATLVEYSLIQDINGLRDSVLYIWVIQPNGQIDFRSVDLKTLNTPLNNLATISRNAIGVRGRSEIEVVAEIDPQEQKTHLQKLHELLIEPIADLLPQDSNQRVILIPQGNLFLVPFSALQDATGKYLLEKHTLVLAPSIQVLELTHKERQGDKNRQWSADKALIVGNPTMPDLSRIDPNLTSLRLDPLPAAEREATTIGQLFNTQPLLGSEATEVEVVRRMKTARLIHLATHGLLDSLRESTKVSTSKIPGAIALAPSGNDKTNNGLLTTEEIASMQLDAELVVLSACDTGRGDIYGGDSVFGLSRSFFAAGVPSVIVSLWAVPDAPTAELMTQFYKNLQQNPDKAQALRQAMLTTMKTHPNPRDWAGFTLIGEAE